MKKKSNIYLPDISVCKLNLLRGLEENEYIDKWPLHLKYSKTEYDRLTYKLNLYTWAWYKQTQWIVKLNLYISLSYFVLLYFKCNSHLFMCSFSSSPVGLCYKLKYWANIVYSFLYLNSVSFSIPCC